MATFKISDRADGFRIELIGRFAGACVNELRSTWQDALRKTSPQPFTIDLGRISGWDAEGRKLLRDMQQHGTQFAAGSPQALVFLREISTSAQRPTLVEATVHEEKPRRKENGPTAAAKPLSKAAGG